MARKSAEKLPLLSKPREAYLPHMLRSEKNSLFTQEEERAEYSRLSRMARKRLKRLGESEFSTGETYQMYKNGFPALKDIQSPAQLHSALADVTKYLLTARGSVKGARDVDKRILQTLHEQKDISGKPLFSDIKTGEDLKKFGRFMNSYKEAHPDAVASGMYDSGAAAELYNIARSEGLRVDIILRDADQWINHLDDLREMQGEYSSASAYAKALGIRITTPKELARRKT